MPDPTEALRKERLVELICEPGSRADLEAQYRPVWTTDELSRDFSVVGFMTPFCVVVRHDDGVRGSVEFQHNPRFYFNFQPE